MKYTLFWWFALCVFIIPGESSPRLQGNSFTTAPFLGAFRQGSSFVTRLKESLKTGNTNIPFRIRQRAQLPSLLLRPPLDRWRPLIQTTARPVTNTHPTFFFTPSSTSTLVPTTTPLSSPTTLKFTAEDAFFGNALRRAFLNLRNSTTTRLSSTRQVRTGLQASSSAFLPRSVLPNFPRASLVSTSSRWRGLRPLLTKIIDTPKDNKFISVFQKSPRSLQSASVVHADNLQDIRFENVPTSTISTVEQFFSKLREAELLQIRKDKNKRKLIINKKKQVNNINITIDDSIPTTFSPPLDINSITSKITNKKQFLFTTTPRGTTPFAPSARSIAASSSFSSTSISSSSSASKSSTSLPSLTTKSLSLLHFIGNNGNNKDLFPSSNNLPIYYDQTRIQENTAEQKSTSRPVQNAQDDKDIKEEITDVPEGTEKGRVLEKMKKTKENSRVKEFPQFLNPASTLLSLLYLFHNEEEQDVNQSSKRDVSKDVIKEMNISTSVTKCPKLYDDVQIICDINTTAQDLHKHMDRAWKKMRYSGEGPKAELLSFGAGLHSKDPRLSVKEKNSRYVLDIQQFRSSDSGTYECEISHGNVTRTSQIFIFACL